MKCLFIIHAIKKIFEQKFSINVMFCEIIIFMLDMFRMFRIFRIFCMFRNFIIIIIFFKWNKILDSKWRLRRIYLKFYFFVVVVFLHTWSFVLIFFNFLLSQSDEICCLSFNLEIMNRLKHLIWNNVDVFLQFL